MAVHGEVSVRYADLAQAVARGDVYVVEPARQFRLMGCRADLYEVLERNDLVEILTEPENVGARHPRHRIVLTGAGLDALENRS